MKISVDGVFSSLTKTAFIRVVVRDLDDFVCTGLTMCLDGPHTAATTEAIAFCESIRLTVSVQWTNALIEGGAINIVNLLANPSIDLSTIGIQLEEIRIQLSLFSSLKIQYFNIVANKVVYELAH
ncbi:hypothetical protein V6N12_028491 [Hibiscus sabdariffa]|uniref:RNase H type-1 domain-containing protein n=1 Tax=Hibiscus sabdariffa TaxID=183260 RepID=A0ABR2F600_9ROSI